jgi:hypothetical protein
VDEPLSERTGVLVVRVWLEDDDPARLRARVTGAHDDTRPHVPVGVAATRAGVLECVAAWLDAFPPG